MMIIRLRAVVGVGLLKWKEPELAALTTVLVSQKKGKGRRGEEGNAVKMETMLFKTDLTC